MFSGHGDPLLVHCDEVGSAALVRDRGQVRKVNVNFHHLLTWLELAAINTLTGVVQHLVVDVDQVAGLNVVAHEAGSADEMGRRTAGVEPFLSDGVSNCAICRIGTGGVGCEDVRNETAGAGQVHMA